MAPKIELGNSHEWLLIYCGTSLWEFFGAPFSVNGGLFAGLACRAAGLH